MNSFNEPQGTSGKSNRPSLLRRLFGKKNGRSIPADKASVRHLTSTNPLEEVRRYSHAWDIEKDRDGSVWFYPTYGGSYVNPPYTAEAFYAQARPELKSWLEECLAVKPDFTLTTHQLNVMEHYWENAETTVMVDKPYFSLESGNYPRVGISLVEQVLMENEGLSIPYAHIYVMDKTPCGQYYATERFHSAIDINAIWLDLHHPQWRLLQTMGENLGLEGENLKCLLFCIGPFAQSQHTPEATSLLSIDAIDLASEP